MGCPIVTDSGGCAEVVDDGESDYVVPVKDADAIAAKVLDLYENPRLIASMSIKCRKKINSELSIQVTIDQYLDFFKVLLGNS